MMLGTHFEDKSQACFSCRSKSSYISLVEICDINFIKILYHNTLKVVSKWLRLKNQVSCE